MPLEERKKLKDISEKLSSKISNLNKKLDFQLESSYSITNQMTHPKNFERNNNFKTNDNSKTIKKQQNFTNSCSYSPFKETIVTMPNSINSDIKKKILEAEKQIFSENNNILENKSIQFNSSDKKNKLSYIDNELIRKIDRIKSVFDVDLRETIEKIYHLTLQTKKNIEREKKTSNLYSQVEKKKDEGFAIKVINAPTIPIEDFMDETEVIIRDIKKDVTEELHSLYDSVLNKIK